MKRDPIYGMMAEFDTPQALIEAARKTHQAGYKKIDAYSPFPVEGLAEAIGFKHNKVAFAVLIGGICGAVGGYALLYWMTVIAYPHNVGGRPLHSWPAYIPITFECMILLSALTALVAMLAMTGLRLSEALSPRQKDVALVVLLVSIRESKTSPQSVLQLANVRRPSVRQKAAPRGRR